MFVIAFVKHDYNRNEANLAPARDLLQSKTPNHYSPLFPLLQRVLCCLFLITNINIPIKISKNPPKKTAVLHGCGHLIVNPIPSANQPTMINNIPPIIFIIFFDLKSILSVELE